MLIRYWQPLQEMDLMRRQLDRLFDDLMPVDRTTQIESPNQAAPATNQPAWRPAIELHETEATVILSAQLPGIEVKDLNIEVTQEQVSLAGHRSQQKTDGEGLFKSEFRYGSFHRVVSLPVAVQNNKVEAQYKDGVLTLTLPKVEARTKVVKVSLSDSAAATNAAEAATAQPTEPEAAPSNLQ